MSKQRDFADYNAAPVLARLEKMIEEGRSRNIDVIYDDLSIFDWWPKKLNINHMKQMRTFLKEAIKLGYTGYVCFKVGDYGCANGMWACKNPTTDGYSPKGETIYRSFTPAYTYYAAQDKKGKWFPGTETDGQEYNSCKTIKQLEALVARI